MTLAQLQTNIEIVQETFTECGIHPSSVKVRTNLVGDIICDSGKGLVMTINTSYDHKESLSSPMPHSMINSGLDRGE